MRFSVLHKPLPRLHPLRGRDLDGRGSNRLLQDAYQHLRIQATPPPVNVLTLRRAGLQGDEAKLFDLNPGEVSAVLDLPASFAFVKLESKDPCRCNPFARRSRPHCAATACKTK